MASSAYDRSYPRLLESSCKLYDTGKPLYPPRLRNYMARGFVGSSGDKARVVFVDSLRALAAHRRDNLFREYPDERTGHLA